MHRKYNERLSVLETDLIYSEEVDEHADAVEESCGDFLMNCSSFFHSRLIFWIEILKSN